MIGFVKRATSRFAHLVSHSMALAGMLALGVYATPLAAQTSPDAPAPMFNNVDANGVDVTTGQFRFSMAEGTIGSGPGAVTLARFWGDGAWRDNWSGGLYKIGTGSSEITYIDFGGTSDSFTLSGGIYTTREGNGSTLTYDSGDGTFLYKNATGIQMTFVAQQSGKFVVGQVCPAGASGCSRPVSITSPTGLTFYVSWTEAEKCIGGGSECVTKFYYRFAGVSSSAGYGVSITYQNDNPGATNAAPPADWYVRTGASFGSSAGSCSGACPSMAYSTSTPLTLTDAMGRVWRFTMTGSNLTGIKRPGSASADTTTITYSSGKVSQVVRDGVTTNYAYSTVSGVLTTTVTDANSNTVAIETDTAVGRPRKVTDQLSRVTQQTYDSSYRPLVTTWPESNTLTRAYDARGNIVSTTLAPKTSGPSPIITSATYPSTCTNPACNKPVTSTDARTHVTNYDYNTTTGQLIKVTLPAPTSGAVRPETRYGYAATAGVSMPTSVSTCRTTASCAAGADEVKTTISYNNNLLPSTVTSGGGDGVLTASASFTYTSAGDRASVDGPLLSPVVDVTTLFYNADRELLLTVGPDPDGAGALKNRAAKLTYNADGQVTLAEQGTANADGTSFAALQSVATTYDANGRKTIDASLGGSTTYAVNQYSYDALGRHECSAQRMNSAAWGTLTSACSLQTTGSFGPDRINKTTYDAASEVTKTTSAYLTADVADDATLTYTANGKLETLVDAKGYKTTYEYDDFDRLLKRRYPLPSTTGSSSTTDYDGYSYDATSNSLTHRIRDNRSIAFTYDDLNRVTYKQPPSGGFYDNPVVYYYDNLGRLTNAGGEVPISFTYDALGRVASEQSYFGTKTMLYDLAGRMTRLTYPGGFAVGYDRLVTGEVSSIRENPATPGPELAAYSYDDLGRRTGMMRLSGASTSYQYDGISRLTQLAYNFSGLTYDQVANFTYNPASQITTRTSIDAFSYGLSNEDKTETPNGLNQLTAQASTGLSYDGMGNVSAIGSAGYTYTSENRLATTPPGWMAYDQIGRLFQKSSYGTVQMFDSLGSQIITELDASYNPVARFVWGPGTDELLVTYSGTSLATRSWAAQDERGSVVAYAADSSVVTSVNTYDDYGTPASGNTGRFGYTGQAWLPELGMNYYKARMYAPGLGRFMQSDPIGYRGGINLYAYVKGDPINATDPLGLELNYPDANGLITATAHYTFDIDAFLARLFHGDGNVKEGGGGGGGNGGRLTDPIPEIKLPEDQQCAAPKSTAGTVALWADRIGEGADATAVTAGLLGLAAAPTGAGFVVFEGTALVAGTVGRIASLVSIGANLVDGNVDGAAQSAVSLIGGSLAGYGTKGLVGGSMAAQRMFNNLSASQARIVNVAGDGVAAGYARLVGRIGC